MRRFIRVDLPPEPIINDKCVRKRLKQSLCDSCSKVCPVDAITSCILCSACAKVCDEGAITIEDNRFIIDEKRCTGCMNCQVVCFPKSIKVVEQIAKNSTPTHYHYYDAQCDKCRLAFFAWEPNATLCPICTQHQKQGWL
ncbi:hypothetical protein AABY23_003398 [Proteus mirabilis]